MNILPGVNMQSNHALVWINHRSAYVIHIDHDREEVTSINAQHSKEHLHHKAHTVGDGNSKPHPDYYLNVVNAVGNCAEVLVVGPADAKTEFVKFAEKSHPDFAKHIVKVETLDRATMGELIDHARHYFAMVKPRLGPQQHHA
jgi:stalled ribosome rescue protein Dom34